MTMTSAEAAACLGVKRATLYSYVTRGLVRTVDGPGRGKRYLATDIWALKRRAAAAKGHAAAASIALDWGAPVLSTAISAVDRDGPSYRGRSAWSLAERDTPFEVVARGLWTGFEHAHAAPLCDGADEGWTSILERAEPKDAPSAWLLAVALAESSVTKPEALLDRFVTSLGHVVGLRPSSRGPVADRLVEMYGLDPADAELVQRGLVLCADHELNASTFAARIAASTGASLGAAVIAALGTFLGPRHGLQVFDVAAGVGEIGSNAPDIVVQAQIAEGRLRGYGHPLYPDGDPRAEALLGWIVGRSGPQLDATWAHMEVAKRLGAPPPALDMALLALANALGAPPAFAVTVFAVGRVAGWLAHVLEQRTTPGILRPRARYVGPDH